jgi:hypothetical protein
MAMDSENSSVGTDSFLDVITNFVGILIILVMVVGDRAKHAPLPEVAPPVDKQLEAAAAENTAIEREVHEIAAQMEVVTAEMAARTFERDQLQTLVAAVEHDIREKRLALDERSRRQFDAQSELAEAEAELTRLKKELHEAGDTDAPQTITVESYPTPIGKTVDGKEAHFQLLGGRLAFVPFEALIDRLGVTVREKFSRMDASPEIIDTLGPIGGFRMRYLVERFDTPQGSYLRVGRIELLPTSGQLGETLEQALAQGSQLREKLRMMAPGQYTITVWTYPDSFEEFRQLKKELYEMGYAVAGRPLPDGMPIGASPHGSKSSAQ